MKTLKISILTATAALAFSANAADMIFEAGDDKLSTQICVDVAMNNPFALRRDIGKMMSVSKLKVSTYKLVANKLRCNNEHIVHFAQRFGADKTAAYINRYAAKKVIIQKVAETTKDIEQLKTGDAKVILVTSNFQQN